MRYPFPPPSVPTLANGPGPRWAYLVIWEQKGLFPLHDYTKFNQELVSQDLWWHYFGNTWIVVRTETLGELAQKLQSLLKREDYLLVMPAVGPVWGQLPPEAWNWMTENLHRITAW
jgi:hypothetical protein